MSKLKSRGCITSYDIGEAEREGKLNIADNIACPFCDREVTWKPRRCARCIYAVLLRMRCISYVRMEDRRIRIIRSAESQA